jgi:reverse gyrase
VRHPIIQLLGEIEEDRVPFTLYIKRRENVNDKGLADIMKERDFGTPAMQTQITKHLLALRYIVRDKKDRKITAKTEN